MSPGAPVAPPLPLTRRRVEVRLDEPPTTWSRAVAVADMPPVDVYRRMRARKKRVRVRRHLPPACARAQARIAREAWKVCLHPFTGPVIVTIEAVFPRVQRLDKLHPGRHRHSVTPDIDNVAKQVLDGLQRDAAGNKPSKRPPGGWPGVLADDCRVAELTVRKFYAAAGEDPHLLIILEEA